MDAGYHVGVAFPIFSHNGAIRPMSEATIPLSNIEYTYGFGVYEIIRVTRGTPRFMADHVERLFRSAQIIELEHPFTPNTVTQWIESLVAELGKETVCNLKILLIGARKPEDCQLFIIPLAPLFPEKKLYTRGATAITFENERMYPQAKTLNMFGSYIAYRKARQLDAYDALLVDRHGCIAEGTRTNFFCIKGRTIHSPPQEDILEGVTRKHMLEVAKKADFDVVQKRIPMKSLPDFDCAFLTSTSTGIVPLKKIDGHEFAEAPTKELKELMDSFEKAVKEGEQ